MRNDRRTSLVSSRSNNRSNNSYTTRAMDRKNRAIKAICPGRGKSNNTPVFFRPSILSLPPSSLPPRLRTRHARSPSGEIAELILRQQMVQPILSMTMQSASQTETDGTHRGVRRVSVDSRKAGSNRLSTTELTRSFSIFPPGKAEYAGWQGEESASDESRCDVRRSREMRLGTRN